MDSTEIVPRLWKLHHVIKQPVHIWIKHRMLTIDFYKERRKIWKKYILSYTASKLKVLYCIVFYLFLFNYQHLLKKHIQCQGRVNSFWALKTTKWPKMSKLRHFPWFLGKFYFVETSPRSLGFSIFFSDFMVIFGYSPALHVLMTPS